MSGIVLLFALGIVLLTLEVVVPGGVLGVLGGLAMLGGCALAFLEFGPSGGGIAILTALGCLGLGLFIEFRVLPKTRYGKKFFLNQSVDAMSQPLPADPALVSRGNGGSAAPSYAQQDAGQWGNGQCDRSPTGLRAAGQATV